MSATGGLSYARAVLERALQRLDGGLYTGNMTFPAELAGIAAHLGRETGLCRLSPDPMEDVGGSSLKAGYTEEDGLRKMGAVPMPAPDEPAFPRPPAHPQWPGSAWAVTVYLLVDVLHDDEAMAEIRDSKGSLRAGATSELLRIFTLACKALEGERVA